MNIQDIADFIDLVKNPDKYEKVLSNIRDEQARLNAVIETVGKASELESLRTEVENKASNLEASYIVKSEALDKSFSNKTKKVEKLQADLESKLLEATQAVNDANLKQQAAENLANSFAGRDKKLREQEEQIANLRIQLQSNVDEYNSKLEKIRSLGIL